MPGTSRSLYPVFVFQRESKDHRGRLVRSAVRRAPDLDCRELTSVQGYFLDDGTPIQRWERRAVSIQRGSPDPLLFEVPEDYAELPPSQVSRRTIEARTGKPFGSDPKHDRLLPGMERMDQAYWKARLVR
jgi:hypothetical protein